MNQEALLATEIAIAASVSLAVIAYLRGILRSMLLEICDRQPQRAEYWVRMLDVLMLVSPLILTLMFSVEGGGLFEALRRAVLMVLLGQFISLIVVARIIYGFTASTAPRPAEAAGRAAASLQ